ncbi:MAG TPA: L-tyrosine/L-tryptophan isonitrile synthase family protein [Flavobacterium sp.]|nr:L-tyrosine/L-tryptophan isonitrile synthase family protein [Flavobacterium sp.]
MYLFSQEGFENITMETISKESGLKETDVYLYFGNKEDIVLFLYQSINSDWQLYVNSLFHDKLSDRFETALITKIELMEPYSTVLTNMLGVLISDSKVSVNAPQTSHIRTIGLHTINEIINGSTDSKKLKKKIVQLPSILYIIHWAILLLYLKSQNKEKTIATIKTITKTLKKANKLSFAFSFFPLLNDISTWVDEFINENIQLNHSINREIFKIIANNRKINELDKNCTNSYCDTCFNIHETKINYFTSQNIPIHFILPAFPAKSPNPEKVLGTMPDLGEEIALTTLENLCKEIKSIYSPGASLTICSDGRIFSELVGITDELVTEYVENIKELITKLNLQHINIVNLEDLMEADSFDQQRKKIIDTYAEPLEDLKNRRKMDTEFQNLFNGIHRFITEDRRVLYPNLSGTQIKKGAKLIALKVIQNSNAWTRFLLYNFPNSIRLSIHPYNSHNDKIGVQLTKATDNWITPWHGVIVLEKDGYILMKKSEAEKKGARLIMKNNQPYYYTLIPEQ